ncbi:MAG: YCF48-related protein, partial [Pirellulales bacterium]|nr:YCF48-related protein [Pirellulales bacterium]
MANERPGQIAASLAEAMRDDAKLHDVTFVDARNGWAVGDRGVIWNTNDGGNTWSSQASGVDFGLTSVQFIDKLNGWVAGGWIDPWLHTSRGVVLRTRDGGKSWKPTAELLLPRIRRIKFFDARRGWALTEHSEMFPTGAFLTTDGGRTWAPVSSNQTKSWQVADFFDADHAAAIGLDGIPKLLSRRGLGDARSPGVGTRRVRSMRVEGSGRGWVVGDRGLVLQTADRGLNWQTPPGETPRELVSMTELSAIAGGGDHVWLAGSPGTRVLHSADAGRTWQVFNTGQQSAITAMYFVDPRRGWAVGALGTILSTRDGGRGWQRQRAGGDRAAYMAVFATADELPMELLAKLSAEEGYFGTALIIANRASDSGSVDRIKYAGRIEHAAIASGASTAQLLSAFDAKSSELRLPVAAIVEEWNRANDGRALKRLEESLVRQIRTWRPSVIFTSRASPRGESALSHIVNQVTLRAIESAADPTRYIEHTTHAGLESWQVKKVFTALPDGELGAVNLTTSQLATRLGKSLATFAMPARALVEHDAREPEETLGFGLVVNRLTDAVGRRDFFSGIHLAHGDGARRRLVEPDA